MQRGLSFAIILALTSTAFADPGGTIHVTRLEATSRDGKAIIHLEIEGESWRSLQERGAWTNLHVQAPNQTPETSLAYPLTEARSRLALDVGDPVPESLVVWLTSNDPNGVTTDTMSIGGVATRSLELRLRQKQEPTVQATNWAASADVIAACGQFTQNAGHCLGAAARARFNPTTVIGTCGQSVNTYALVDQCIDLAVTASAEPSQRLTTCRNASNTYDGVMTCFKSATRARYEPSAGIQACRDAANTYDLVLSCVDVIADARSDPSGLVTACRQSVQSYDQLLGCIRQGLPR